MDADPRDPEAILALIKESEEIIRTTQAHLTNVKKTLHEQELAYAKAKFGVEPGVVVMGTGGRMPGEHRVASIEPRNYSKDRKPWLMGNPKKKDGTFGKSVVHLFEYWEPIKP